MPHRTVGKLPQPFALKIETWEQFSELLRVLVIAQRGAMLAHRQEVMTALLPISRQLSSSTLLDDWNCGDPDCEACNGNGSKVIQLFGPEGEA